MTHHTQVARSILVAQASTATSTRLRNEANAYNRIVIGRDGPAHTVTLEVRAWEGAFFTPGLVSCYRRDGERWTLIHQDTGFRLPDARTA